MTKNTPLDKVGQILICLLLPPLATFFIWLGLFTGRYSHLSKLQHIGVFLASIIPPAPIILIFAGIDIW